LRFDGSDEAITPTGQSFYKLRIVCGILKGFSKFVHCLVQAAIEINEGAGWPQTSHQFFASYQTPGALQHSDKNFSRLLLEHSQSLFVPQLSGLRVKFESAEGIPIRSLGKAFQLHSPLG
jgi:hypothetical protein